MREAWRSMRRRPAFTATAVAILAAGIAASVAMFSVVDAVLLAELPFERPSELRWLWSERPDGARGPFSIADFVDLRARGGPLDGVAAFANFSANLTHENEPERLTGMRVSTNAFRLLGVVPAVGRVLAPGDESRRIVLLGDGLWQRRFGGDRAIVGRSLWLNGEPYEVAGVLPRAFVFPIREAQLAIPLDEDQARRIEGDVNFLRVIGRLVPATSDRAAADQLSAIARELQRIRPAANARKSAIALEPLHDYLVGAYGATIRLLFGAVVLVLLLACANLGSLSAARAAARRSELAVRTALGASRIELARQLLLEHVAIAIVAGVLGAALALPLARGLTSLAPAALFSGHVAISVRIVLFAVATSLTAGLLIGLAPALKREESLVDALRGTGRTSAGRRELLTRRIVVASEAAASLVLLVATALLLRSFVNLETVRTGFEPVHALALRLSLPRQRYTDARAVLAFQRQLDERLRVLPSATAVGSVSLLPFGGLRASVDVVVDGRPVPQERVPEAEYRLATPHYFDAVGARLVAGRPFTDADRNGAPAVAVVNETLAARMWPGGGAVGSHIRIEPGARVEQVVEVVGIVNDVKQYALDGQPTMDLYVPFAQLPEANVVWVTNNQFWVIRTAAAPEQLVAAARAAVRAVDPDVAATEVTPLADIVDRSLAARRFNIWLLEAFAAAALTLTVCGIYAVTSFAVAERRHELGIRAALGASSAQLVGRVVADDLGPILLGILSGLVISIAGSGFIAHLLFGVAATDHVAFAGAAVLLLAVSAVACGAPAARASRVDPLRALRAD